VCVCCVVNVLHACSRGYMCVCVNVFLCVGVDW